MGFAADGYARSTRRLGVVCVTCGAGSDNVVNPVAGAYAELAQDWGGVGFVAEGATALRDALRVAHEVKGFALIECRVPQGDFSPISRRYIKASARRGRPSRR